MKILKCPVCGNTEEFYERVHATQTNYFHQDAEGNIKKIGIEQKRCSDSDTRLYCSHCGKELEEDYELFLDKYSDSLFNIR